MARTCLLRRGLINKGSAVPVRRVASPLFGVLAGFGVAMVSGCGTHTDVTSASDGIHHTAHHNISALLGGKTSPTPHSAGEDDTILTDTSGSFLTLESDSGFCQKLGATPMLNITLMFGMKRPHGADITSTEWQNFLRTTITPRFPAGLSVLPSDGQWQDRTTGKVQQEPSRLVLVTVPENTPQLAANLAFVRTTYKSQFSQQAVGLTVTHACASF